MTKEQDKTIGRITARMSEIIGKPCKAQLSDLGGTVGIWVTGDGDTLSDLIIGYANAKEIERQFYAFEKGWNMATNKVNETKMTIKEFLEKELAADANEFEKQYGKMLSECIVYGIKRNGRKFFYCHGYVSSTSITCILPKDELAFREFCKRQGLNIHEETNSHGARMLVVTM